MKKKVQLLMTIPKDEKCIEYTKKLAKRLEKESIEYEVVHVNTEEEFIKLIFNDNNTLVLEPCRYAYYYRDVWNNLEQNNISRVVFNRCKYLRGREGTNRVVISSNDENINRTLLGMLRKDGFDVTFCSEEIDLNYLQLLYNSCNIYITATGKPSKVGDMSNMEVNVIDVTGDLETLTYALGSLYRKKDVERDALEILISNIK